MKYQKQDLQNWRIFRIKNCLKKITVLLSFIFCCLGFSGCAAFRSAPEYNLLKQDKNSIRKALNENYSGIKSLYGRAKISFSDAENRSQSSGLIYYKISDSLFITLEGAIGETEAVLFLRPDSFFVENYYDKFTVQDLRSAFSLRRIGGPDLPFEDLKYSLYGYEPIKEDFILTGITEEFITLKNPVSPSRWQEIKVNKNLVIEEVKGYYNDQLEYLKQYDFFFYQNDHYLPTRIVFKKASPPEKLTIFFEKLELDRYYQPDYHKQGEK